MSMRIFYFGSLTVAALGSVACTGTVGADGPGDETIASAPSALIGVEDDRGNRHVVHLESYFDWRIAAKSVAPILHTRELCAGLIVGPRAIITDNRCIEGRTVWRTNVDGPAYPDGTQMVQTGHVRLEVWMHDKTGAKRKIAELLPQSQTSPYYGEKIIDEQDLAVLALPDSQAMTLDRECEFETMKLCTRLPTRTVPSNQSEVLHGTWTLGQISQTQSNTDHIVLDELGQTWMNFEAFDSVYPLAPLGTGTDWTLANYYMLPDRSHWGDRGAGPLQKGVVFKDLLGVYRGSPAHDPSSTPDCQLCTAEVGYGTSFLDAGMQSWIRQKVAELALVAPTDGYFDGGQSTPGGTDSGFFACCGDGVCESDKGETRARCMADCPPQRCEEVPWFEGSLQYADGTPGYCKHGGYNLAYKIDGADDHWAGGLAQPAYNWTSNDLSPVSAQLLYAGKSAGIGADRSGLTSSYNEILLKAAGEGAFDMESIRATPAGWKLLRLTDLFAPKGSCGSCVGVEYPVFPMDAPIPATPADTLAKLNVVFGTSVGPRGCELAGVWHEQRWIYGDLMAFGAGSHECGQWAAERVGFGFFETAAPYAGVRRAWGNHETKFVYVFARDRRYLVADAVCPDVDLGTGGGGGDTLDPVDPLP